MIEIVVLGTPVAKGRPRFAKETGHAYTPDKTRNFEAALKYAAMQAMGDRPPLEGPVKLTMRVVLPVAKSWPKARRALALLNLILPTKKPDFDNYQKTVDALNEVVWLDDGQITDSHFTKRYGDKPGTWIQVDKMNPEEDTFG